MIRAVVATVGIGIGAMATSTPAHADFLLGLTTLDSLMGINLEWNGTFGGPWLLVGAYESPEGFGFENSTAAAGYRWYNKGGFDKTGYFGGIVVGDLNGDANNNGFGGGGELGYQWVTEHLRMTLNGGIALVEGIDPLIDEGEIKPKALFGASVSLRY